MRCLLVSYAELGVNSTEHVVAFARGLAALGWQVNLAVLLLDVSTRRFRFYSCAANGPLVAIDDEAELAPADVVHVWTPRGAIWDFIGRHSRLIGRALILHLEDDEDEVLKAFNPTSARRGIRLGAHALHRAQLDHLSHPLLARCLAGCADGVTLLSPELAGGVPSTSLSLRIVPPLDPAWFTATGEQAQADGEHTVVFSGGVHSAVAADFHALCRAVGLLVEKGRSVRLVRCGPAAMPPRLLKQGARLAKNFRDAGFLSREELASLLAGATVLVQPGGPTLFNLRRFPAKLASYLASGTPVVMPACYDWIGVNHGEHVITFNNGTAEDIARAIETVLDAPSQSREMGKRAASFAREMFGPVPCCRPLDEFYRKVLERPLGVSWQSIRRPRVELPLWLAAQPSLTGIEFRSALGAFAAEEQQRVSAYSAPTNYPPQNVAPLVSVVVPNFDHRRFLPERLQSIFAQTHRNFEIIFLDDASTDGSLDYVRSLKSPFPIRILPNEVNGGSVFRQWHRGITEARGKFVWIAESDDSCQPDLIEKLLAVAQRNSAIGIAYAQSRLIDENGKDLGSLRVDTDEIDAERWRHDYVNSGRDEAARYLVVRNTIPNASACLFRRAALIEADLPSLPQRVCGDWMAYARICARHEVAFVAEELNLYRRHGATARERANRAGGFVAEMYAVQNYIADHFEISPDAREAASRATFRSLLHLVRNQGGNRVFIDTSGVMAVATRFDPRFRERLSGGATETPPMLSVRFDEAAPPALELRRPHDPLRWTTVNVAEGRGRAIIIPIIGPGLVALRRVRLLNPQTAAVWWAAESTDDYRQIELDGQAHRVGCDGALEIFSWGAEPKLLLPLPKDLGDGTAYKLEFEIRLSGLRSYECPFEEGRPQRKKRALFILPHLELGGADRCNLDVIAQLTRRFDWDVTVATTRRSADAWREAFQALTDDAFMLHRFLPLEHYGEFLAYLIESRRPDVVYLSHTELGYRLLPWLKESFPGLPFIDLLHLVMDDWKQGGFPRFSGESRAWLDRTVVTSQWLKARAVELGCDEQRLRVIYTGINTAEWRRTAELTRLAQARWALPTDRVVILFAARFAVQKSPEILPPIIRALEARGRKFLLLLAGDGPQRAWLEEHACRAHPSSVRLLGAVPPQDMRMLMSAADILLLPSQAEGVALVLFEAMSMGVVPVATDVGGQRELVTPECGRLVAPGPQVIASLVEALDALLIDAEARARCAAQGRARVEAEFDLDRTGEQIEALFRTRAEAALVDWTALPLRSEIPRALLDDLNEMAADELTGDVWAQQMKAGKWWPTAVSRIAAFLRATPLRHAVRQLEMRYGERLGRWIVSKS
jgi:glycosyltransferase involved in cell wall biosynthesis